ncbi:MAG: 50S ribosomal protein L22 [Kiritimatiellae bacterium]|nr:50S ribosomal protein L22 [Kiritimatiellia bacterium]
MDIVAKTRYARISASKAADLARAVRGQPVDRAVRTLAGSQRKGAVLMLKTLKAAIANAQNNAKLDATKLFVRDAAVEQGPAMKRFWPRSRGMVSPVLRRMSHIRIVLTDENPSAK